MNMDESNEIKIKQLIARCSLFRFEECGQLSLPFSVANFNAKLVPQFIKFYPLTSKWNFKQRTYQTSSLNSSCFWACETHPSPEMSH